MLSRKDVRRKQIRLLLEHGVLPVSVDYRLCPEVRLVDGPMKDARSAFVWAKKTLPGLNLKSTSGMRVDGSRTAVIGWSSGGTVALSLSWTARQMEGIRAPDAVLSFYCPTDFDDPCRPTLSLFVPVAKHRPFCLFHC